MPDIKIVTEVAGRVCALPVEVGASIGEGDDIAFVEAMKMEIPVAAPAAGTAQNDSRQPRRRGCRRTGPRHPRDLNALSHATCRIKQHRTGFGVRRGDVDVQREITRATGKDMNSSRSASFPKAEDWAAAEAAFAAVSHRMPCGFCLGDWRRRCRLHSGTRQGRSRSFRHQPRHPRRPCLRGRRQPDSLHHPVDVKAVRVRAGAGHAGRSAGGKRNRRRAVGRSLQFDPPQRRQPSLQSDGQCRRDRLFRPDPTRPRATAPSTISARRSAGLPGASSASTRRSMPPKARPATATARSAISCATPPSSRTTSARCWRSISGNARCW